MMEKLYNIWTLVSYVFAMLIGLSMLVAVPTMFITGNYLAAAGTIGFTLLFYSVLLGSVKTETSN